MQLALHEMCEKLKRVNKKRDKAVLKLMEEREKYSRLRNLADSAHTVMNQQAFDALLAASSQWEAQTARSEHKRRAEEREGHVQQFQEREAELQKQLEQQRSLNEELSQVLHARGYEEVEPVSRTPYVKPPPPPPSSTTPRFMTFSLKDKN